MLARPLRVRLHAEFVSVTRTGHKARSGCVVVYRTCATSDGETPQAVSRAGLIVGRPVGNAVTRHRVARLIRAELAELLPQAQGELVVVRALPTSASVSPSQLRQDLQIALGRLRGRGPHSANAHRSSILSLVHDPGTVPEVSS